MPSSFYFKIEIKNNNKHILRLPILLLFNREREREKI